MPPRRSSKKRKKRVGKSKSKSKSRSRSRSRRRGGAVKKKAKTPKKASKKKTPSKSPKTNPSKSKSSKSKPKKKGPFKKIITIISDDKAEIERCTKYKGDSTQCRTNNCFYDYDVCGFLAARLVTILYYCGLSNPPSNGSYLVPIYL